MSQPHAALEAAVAAVLGDATHVTGAPALAPATVPDALPAAAPVTTPAVLAAMAAHSGPSPSLLPSAGSSPSRADGVHAQAANRANDAAADPMPRFDPTPIPDVDELFEEPMASVLRKELAITGTADEVAVKAAWALRLPHNPECSVAGLLLKCLECIQGSPTVVAWLKHARGLSSALVEQRSTPLGAVVWAKPLSLVFAENNILLPMMWMTETVATIGKKLLDLLCPIGGWGHPDVLTERTQTTTLALMLGVSSPIARHPHSRQKMLVQCVHALCKWDKRLWGDGLHAPGEHVPLDLLGLVHGSTYRALARHERNREEMFEGPPHHRLVLDCNQERGPRSGVCTGYGCPVNLMSALVVREMEYTQDQCDCNDPWSVARRAVADLGLLRPCHGDRLKQVAAKSGGGQSRMGRPLSRTDERRHSRDFLATLLSQCLDAMIVPHGIDSDEWLAGVRPDRLRNVSRMTTDASAQPTSCPNSSLASTSSSTFAGPCQFLDIAPELQLLVRDHLANALRPTSFCALGGSCKTLHACMFEAVWSLRVSYWRAVQLCAHANTAVRHALASWTPVELHQRPTVTLNLLSSLFETTHFQPLVAGSIDVYPPPPLIPHCTIESIETLGCLAKSLDCMKALTVNVCPYVGGRLLESYFPKPAPLNDMLAELMRLNGIGFPSLTSLTMCGVMCNVLGASRLAQVLDGGHMPQLELLCLRHAMMGDGAYCALAQALRKRPALKELMLGGTRIGERGAIELLLPDPAGPASFVELTSLSFGRALPNLNAVRVLIRAMNAGLFPKLSLVRYELCHRHQPCNPDHHHCSPIPVPYLRCRSAGVSTLWR